MLDTEFIEQLIAGQLGYRVDFQSKRKTLSKFGRNPDVAAAAWETVAEQQGSEINETFVSTNIIDSISSDDQSNDVGLIVTIEGHTIDASGNLTFVTQTATLDGTDARTEVTLTTPLARATRAYIGASGTFDSPQAVPTGNIYIYDNTGGQSLGVPSTAAGTKLMIVAGATQSEKCATTISQDDVWVITEFSCAIGDTVGNAALVTVRMETLDVANGGVWRPLGREFTLWADQPGISRPMNPPLIVPANHDFRVRAIADANTAEVYAEARGYLARVI